MIRFDKSDRTILPLCACGWRGEVTASMPAADAQAMDHVHRGHPAPNEMNTYRDAARKRATREK